MLRLAGIAISVGLADSINPTTVGPGLYLATTPRPTRRVALFTLGVFAVNFAAGIGIVLGPGQLLLDVLPRPNATVKHVLELVVGIALVVVAVAMVALRRRLTRHPLPGAGGGGRSALIAGVSIAAVELPTAVPFLAVLATITAADVGAVQEIVLVALFCVAFVAPLLVVMGILAVAGERADPVLRRAAGWLQRWWPVVLAALLAVVGMVLAIHGGVTLLRA